MTATSLGEAQRHSNRVSSSLKEINDLRNQLNNLSQQKIEEGVKYTFVRKESLIVNIKTQVLIDAIKEDIENRLRMISELSDDICEWASNQSEWSDKQ